MRRRADAGRVGGDAPGTAAASGDGLIGALRARRQLLGHLRPLPAWPYPHWRPDIRSRTNRPGSLVRRRHAGHVRQRRCIRSARSVQPGGVDQGPRQSADVDFSEARRRRAPAWVRVGLRRHQTGRHSAVGGELTVTLASEPSKEIQVRTRERLRLGDWYHVAVAYDGSGKAAGLRYLRQRQTLRRPTLSATRSRGSLKTDAPLRVGQQGPGKTFHRTAR